MRGRGTGMTGNVTRAVAAAIVILGLTQAQAEPAKKGGGVSVAVAPFEAKGKVDRSVAEVVASQFEIKVSEVADQTVSQNTLNANAFVQACGQETCELKTTHKLRGTVSALGSRYLINVFLETQATGKKVYTGSRNLPQDEDSLLRAVEDIARDVVECMTGKNCTDEPGPEFAEQQAADAPVAAAVQATGLLKVTSVPPGAEINIDSAPYGNAPMTVPGLSPGDHVVTLSLDGYEPVESIVTVRARQTVALAKTLKEQQGQIEIQSQPAGANAFLDGKFAGKTPVAAKTVKTGTHDVKITLKSYRNYSETVQVASGALAQVSPALEGLPGTLTVNSSPSDASVMVNGQNVGQTPWTGEVNAGDATIDLSLDGYEPQQKTAQIAAGQARSMNVTMKKAAVVKATAGITGAMVTIPSGIFFFGEDNQQFSLPEFKIDKTEVTVAAYAKCVQSGKCSASGLNMPFWNGQDQPSNAQYCNWGKSDRNDHPLNCVDWTQADSFCKWAGKRLPTEQEWEKAARGTDGRTYPWGEQEPTCDRTIMSQGGYGCGQDRTWPVCSKTQGNSPYGACDMAGNVWEWTADWYTVNSKRVLRGGSWYFGDTSSFRAASRNDFGLPVFRDFNSGFRCAQDVK